MRRRVCERFLRWARDLVAKRPGVAGEKVWKPPQGRVAPGLATKAYRGVRDARTQAAHWVRETVEVPACESRALRGERLPGQFLWRGRWYRVVQVCSEWCDGFSRPGPKKVYCYVLTEPEGLFELGYERSIPRGNEPGRWMVHKRMESRSWIG